MNFRTLVISLVWALPFMAHAQDKIYKRNGEVVDAKIKSVGINSITYLRYDNQSGPEYIIIKNEVEKITYQNGNTDVFDRRPMRSPHMHKDAATDLPAGEKFNYKPNVIAIAPLQFTENGLGAGISYERVIDKGGIISFYVPVIMAFNLNNGTYYDYSTGATMNGHQDIMYYAMPGVKIYPTGCYGIARYAIGPSLVIASGQKSTQSYAYDPITGTNNTTYLTQKHVMMGMVVNNSLNINPTPHIYLGLELGFGFTYLNRVGGLNQDTQGLVHGSFKVGYRF